MTSVEDEVMGCMGVDVNETVPGVVGEFWDLELVKITTDEGVVQFWGSL